MTSHRRHSSPEESSLSGVKKRGRYTKNACMNCRRAHVACDNSRPCARCQRKGIECLEQPSRRSRRERKPLKVDCSVQTSCQTVKNVLSGLMTSVSSTNESSTRSSSQNTPNSSTFTPPVVDQSQIEAFSQTISETTPQIQENDPLIENLCPELKFRFHTLHQIVSQQQKLLNQSVAALKQYQTSNHANCSTNQKASNQAPQIDPNMDQRSRLTLFVTSNSEFARCFASDFMPVLVLDRTRAQRCFTNPPFRFNEGEIFCNRIYGDMIGVDSAKYTHPSFNHQSAGFFDWFLTLSTNFHIRHICSLLFQSQSKYVQFKMALGHTSGQSIFVVVKLHLSNHFIWASLEPTPYIDDELIVDGHVMHATTKFAALNEWKLWCQAGERYSHVRHWLDDLLSPTNEQSTNLPTFMIPNKSINLARTPSSSSEATLQSEHDAPNSAASFSGLKSDQFSPTPNMLSAQSNRFDDPFQTKSPMKEEFSNMTSLMSGLPASPTLKVETMTRDTTPTDFDRVSSKLPRSATMFGGLLGSSVSSGSGSDEDDMSDNMSISGLYLLRDDDRDDHLC